MSQRSPTDSARLALERSIDELAELARSGSEPGRFFADVLGRAIQPGGATQAVLWRQSLEGTWTPAGALPKGSLPDETLIELKQELLSDVSTNEQPRIITAAESDTDSKSATARSPQVLSPIRHAGQTIGILETTHAATASGQLPSSTFPFFAALCEITADFLSQQELQQLRRSREVWQQWDRFTQRLWLSLDLPSVCAAVANDGRQLVNCDRVSVLVRRGRSFQLMSVSGVDRIEPRSSATRSLESLAKLASRQTRSTWWDEHELTSTTAETASTDSALNEALRRHCTESGATVIGLAPIIGRRDAKELASPCAVIVFETFQPKPDATEIQSAGETLAHRSALTLRAAIERSEIPFLGLTNRIRSLPMMLRRPSVVLGTLLVMAATAALIFVPANFSVTGQAELWPEHRRDVFATTSGIVDQVLVKHGADVEKDQPLIILRDPILDAETPRIDGEIATINERIKGVQAARLTGGNAPDAVSRARQLTADEQELKVRLLSLSQQKTLLDERRENLTLRSPIAGRVLTWDLTQRLSSRPVERGQSLLTIGETSGPWVVEVHLADKDSGYMLRAQQSVRKDLDVDFLLTSDPDRTHRGHVQDVALISEPHGQMRGALRVIVAFDRAQLDSPRPGATAIPRIHCGQQSIGYVWLHDLINAIKTKLLF